jgi:protein gp37
VSPGCKHCYALTFAERWRGIPGHHFEQGFDLRLWPERLRLPMGWKTPRRIFVNSMSDLFHERVPLEFIQEVFATMIACPQHQFQVLTKRPEQLLKMCGSLTWPDNVWMGVSIETEKYACRSTLLQKVPAMVRFLSVEPLLGPIPVLPLEGIHWVIVGGESGPGARPMLRRWVEDIRRQCRHAGVPFFFKQWGGVRKSETGRTLNGRTFDAMPVGKAVPRPSSLNQSSRPQVLAATAGDLRSRRIGLGSPRRRSARIA